MIVELLEQKKHFLIEFKKFNEAGIINFQKNNFEEIDHFYDGREHLLNIIRHIDNKIENISFDRSDEIKRISIVKLEMNKIVQEILNQDLKIQSLIDVEKSNLIKDLQNISKNKKNVSSYKTKVSKNQIDEEI